MARKKLIKPPETLRDFRKFLALSWNVLGLPEPTPVQDDIANWLQGGPRRIFLGAFRGVGKSWISSAFVVWCLMWNADLKIQVISASKDRADDFTTFTLRLMALLPETQHLLPKPGMRCSRVAFDVAPAKPAHQPSVKSRGITSQLSGGRADIIIADDIEVPNNSATQVMREKLKEAVKEFDAMLLPNGRVIFLGTPQTEDSLYFGLPEGDGEVEGYIKRLWPSRVPGPDLLKLYDGLLAPVIAALAQDPENHGAPTDSRRFDETDLKERELSYGRSGFAMQFMLLPNLADEDRYPLKLRDLIFYDIDPAFGPQRLVWSNDERYRLKDEPCVGRTGDGVFASMPYSNDDGTPMRVLPYTGKLLTIDPSGRGADETAWNVTYMLHSTIYLVDAGGYRDGYDPSTLQGLADMARRYNVQYILFEDNFGDGMYAELFKPYLRATHPVTIEGIRAVGMKEGRIIDTLEPIFNQHRLVVNRKLLGKDLEPVKGSSLETAHQYQLFHQMTRITRERGALIHDDRLDSLAHACKYWMEQLGLDPERAAKDSYEAAQEKERVRFLERANKNEPKSMTDNWLDDPRLIQKY
jgi:hypothetical protein